VPTSVLLAVLAAAGLLALAPALTRRYDATERVAAERATSTARVLTRRRRRRTVPGARPINGPRHVGRVWDAAASGADPGSAKITTASTKTSSPGRAKKATTSATLSRSTRRAPGRRSSGRRRQAPTALHRRRRVFLALVLLNLIELAGVFLVGPGFWIGFSVSFAVLLADLVYLRRRALAGARSRRSRARRAAWVAAEQAAVRREHERRSAERLAHLRRVAAERDDARRRAASPYVERYAPRTAPGPS
jgi:hypothetical protein